jgi:excisionase family DNA binding protein
MVKLEHVSMTGTGEYVSVREASLRTKISMDTLYKWIQAGKLQAYCQGHATRIKMSELLAPVVPRNVGVARRGASRVAAASVTRPHNGGAAGPASKSPAAATEEHEATPAATETE